MITLTPGAAKAQERMERDMRIQSTGTAAYPLIREIFDAVELPPDLEARVLAIIEFVEARK